ncbi:MAG: hypothetical protein HYR63_11165 [Proteobacteria bacterium]|nr:hypothetical protein [Pseudomonadota bacterium]MBI3498218.1 hypothetical protein [Pseudomonadota bacterium]
MTKSIAELIDDLLAARKELVGIPGWREGPHPDEHRLVMPLHIDGVSTGAEFLVTAYPLVGHGKFRIMICAPKCVWKIDHTTDELHVNSFDRPSDILEHSFMQPHYHSWADNRRFSTRSVLPEQLKNARIMPEGVRSFDSSLRWFCGDTNIEQPAKGLIVLPPRTRLL